MTDTKGLHMPLKRHPSRDRLLEILKQMVIAYEDADDMATIRALSPFIDNIKEAIR